MVNINLLPKFHVLPVKSIIFALSSFVMIVFLHWECRAALFEKRENIGVLKKAIHTIDSELSISASKSITFTDLKRNQNFNQLKLLKKLPSTIPMGLYLTELSMTKNKYKLVGYSEKTGVVSDWVSRLTHLQFDVSLQEMLVDKESNDFPIRFSLVIAMPPSN